MFGRLFTRLYTIHYIFRLSTDFAAIRLFLGKLLVFWDTPSTLCGHSHAFRLSTVLRLSTHSYRRVACFFRIPHPQFGTKTTDPIHYKEAVDLVTRVLLDRRNCSMKTSRGKQDTYHQGTIIAASFFESDEVCPSILCLAK